MIKKVKDQTGKELTNADVDIILMKKEVSKIMKSTHATSCTPKDCQCGVDVIEYQLIAFITNALNQQRRNTIKEIREKVNKANDDNPNVYQDGVIMTPEYQCYLDGVIACVNILDEFLTKLEK